MRWPAWFSSKTTGATSLPRECFQSQHWSAADLILRQTRNSNDPLEWRCRPRVSLCQVPLNLLPCPSSRLEALQGECSPVWASCHVAYQSQSWHWCHHALSHLGQHHLLVEQPRLGKLQPYQVSRCLGNLGRLSDPAICLNIRHPNRLWRCSLGSLWVTAASTFTSTVLALRFAYSSEQHARSPLI